MVFKKDVSFMVGYVDAGYMSDPHNARSHTGFAFLCGGTTISWRSVKQILVATSTNHSEIIALYEAARECVWLRRMIGHIQKSCGMNTVDAPPLSMRIMQLVLHKCIWAMLRAISPSILLLNSFTPTSSRRVGR